MVRAIFFDFWCEKNRRATLPGNYPAYYAAIRDALNGVGENPVPASEAIQIMTLIELGIESARHRATLSLV